MDHESALCCLGNYAKDRHFASQISYIKCSIRLECQSGLATNELAENSIQRTPVLITRVSVGYRMENKVSREETW